MFRLLEKLQKNKITYYLDIVGLKKILQREKDEKFKTIIENTNIKMTLTKERRDKDKTESKNNFLTYDFIRRFNPYVDISMDYYIELELTKFNNKVQITIKENYITQRWLNTLYEKGFLVDYQERFKKDTDIKNFLINLQKSIVKKWAGGEFKEENFMIEENISLNTCWEDEKIKEMFAEQMEFYVIKDTILLSDKNTSILKF